jgi:hypothetical protein
MGWRSGFPLGMTTRKAKATATVKRIPFGNDNKRDKSNGNGKCKAKADSLWE